MKKISTPPSDPHELTHEIVLEKLAEYQSARDAVVARRAAWFDVHKRGGAAGTAPPELQRKAKERARELANGHAFSLLPSQDETPVTEEDLVVEQAALETLIAILRQREFPARVAKAAKWFREHETEWRSLCKELVVCAVRIQALERRAAPMAEQMTGADVPLCRFIGWGHTLLAGEGEDRLRELREAAVAEGIISNLEIGKISNG